MLTANQFASQYITCRKTTNDPRVLLIAGTYDNDYIMTYSTDPTHIPYKDWSKEVRALAFFFEWTVKDDERFYAHGVSLLTGLDLRSDYQLINGRRNLSYPVKAPHTYTGGKPEFFKLAKPPLPHHPHTCPRCSAPAYIGALTIDCQKGCFK